MLLNARSPFLPFLGAWIIWLGGYAALLGADFVVRRMPGPGQGLDELPVAITAVLVAGAACGFFLAAARRWPMPHRLLMLLLQVPFAYGAALLMGFAYLCGNGTHCP